MQFLRSGFAAFDNRSRHIPSTLSIGVVVIKFLGELETLITVSVLDL